MNKLFLFLLLAFSTFTMIQSCKHTPSEIVPLPENKDTIKKDTTGNQNKRPCSPDTVYYTRDIQPIFITFCAISGCHTGSRPEGDVDLSTYSKALGGSVIKPYNSSGSKLYEALTDTDPDKKMPPAGGLTSDKIALIKKWIDQGAKDLWCDELGNQNPCDTLNVTYSNTINKIMTDNCTGCHGNSGGVTLSNYAGVKGVVNNGKLWKSVNHLPMAVAMPSGGTKLSTCNLQQIKIWIDAGAPQN